MTDNLLNAAHNILTSTVKHIYGFPEASIISIFTIYLSYNPTMLKARKSGVNSGIAIIPGVLIVCIFLLMSTDGTSPNSSHMEVTYEGIAFPLYIGGKLKFFSNPLFEFSSSPYIATLLGAAGAAIFLVHKQTGQERICYIERYRRAYSNVHALIYQLHNIDHLYQKSGGDTRWN